MTDSDPQRETTPATLSSDVRAFLDEQGLNQASYVPYCALREAEHGMCWRNVEDVVRALGGTISYGWVIWELPRMYLCAQLHAVWASPEGLLLDVTPQPNGKDLILFAPDQSLGRGFGLLRNPDNRTTKIYRFLPSLHEAIAFDAILSAADSQPIRPARRTSRSAIG